MTTIADAPPQIRAEAGGRPARRAVARWAYRLFVRERRQQLVVVGVITVAVAAAVCGVATIYNLPDTQAGTFGTAQQSIRIGAPDSAEIATVVAAAHEHLGTFEVIGHQSVPIPGSSESYDARAQDPAGAFASSTLAVRDGRFPQSADEIAVTDAVATTFAARIGDPITVAGRPRAIVGIVENPHDLGDDFILLAPSELPLATAVTILADAGDGQLSALHDAIGPFSVDIRGSNVSTPAATLALAASSVVYLLVALVAAAGFAVVAQRRMRQLGMLAAVGATDRHLKLVVIVHGAVVGVISSLSGTVLGLGAWFALAHRLEGAAGHRMDPFNLPWVLLAVAGVAGVLVPIVAAWWPSRAMPRMSIVDAISARPPKPRRADASVALAIIFLTGGVVLIDISDQKEALPMVAGIVAIVIGILLASPTAIRLLARLAGHTPVTTRVALRDLGRYQARAGAALAAVSLALGIPIAVVLVASAADRTAAEAAGNGNLADNQLRLRLPLQGQPPTAPSLTPAQLAEVTATVDDLAARLDSATVVPLTMPTDPTTPADDRHLIDLAFPVPGDDHRLSAEPMFVATPQLLAFLGIDLTGVPDSVDVLTTSSVAPLMPTDRKLVTTTNFTIAPPPYTSLPSALITEAGLHRYGLQAATVGWIVEAPHPLTAVQLTDARRVAAAAGFTILSRHGPPSRAALRNIATGAGALFALAILAMTVGTIRSEAASELRTLTATGASSTIRRALTATTAASLALAGVVLGGLGSYVALIGAYAHHLSRLGDVPVANLLAALIGVPLLAGVTGWCLGGREPPTFARPSID